MSVVLAWLSVLCFLLSIAEHGYEIIDLNTNRVWATTGFTDEQWETMTFPPNYKKVHPQNSVALITAIHCPDCTHDGEFIVKPMFNATWNYAAKILQNTTFVPDTDQLLRYTVAEKYQIVLYNGVIVVVSDDVKKNYYILETVDGFRNETASIPLPKGWSLQYIILNDNIEIRLMGSIWCLYDTLDDNFQGPLNQTVLKQLGIA
eukprot:306671_1